MKKPVLVALLATLPLLASLAHAQEVKPEIVIKNQKQFDEDVAAMIKGGKTPQEAREFMLKIEAARQSQPSPEDRAIKVKIANDSVKDDGGLRALRGIELMIPSNRQMFYGAGIPSAVELAANLTAQQETFTLIAVQNARVIEQNDKIIALLQAIIGKK